MLDVLTTSFYIKSPLFDKDEFEHRSSELFDQWDDYVDTYLNLPDYALTLVLEEGSIKGKGKIAALAAALYIGIGEYGDFVSGLKTIHEQANYVSSVLFQEAKREFSCTNQRGNSKRTDGEIIYLRRLFERVQAGGLSPDQALGELHRRWGDDALSSPDFMRTIAANLEMAPKFPEQLSLSNESWPACDDNDSEVPEPRPRAPSGPQTPIPTHYRVEIYRPSRREKKKVKLTKVK